MKEIPIANIPVKLFANVVAINALVLIKLTSQTETKLLDDPTGYSWILAGAGCYLIDE